jgi:autophagy-related protein 18
VGTQQGFKIFQCNPFTLLSSAQIGPVSIIEMIFTTNILAIVGQGEEAQRILTIWDTKIMAGTLDVSFVSKIIALKMNGSTLFAATKDKIFLYDLNGMKLLAKLQSDNHLGRIVLSPNHI